MILDRTIVFGREIMDGSQAKIATFSSGSASGAEVNGAIEAAWTDLLNDPAQLKLAAEALGIDASAIRARLKKPPLMVEPAESGRRHLGSETDYLIQIDLECRGHSVEVAGYGGSAHRNFGTIEAGAYSFPRYVTSSRDDWSKLVSEIETDLWYTAHESPLGHKIEISKIRLDG